MKKLLVFTLSCAIALPLRASGTSGRTGADFLEIPAGARPAALGGTYAALGSDAYSPVWNPAGLGFLPRPEIALQHLSYLESLHYEFASVAVPVSANNAVALSVRNLASGAIPGTDVSNNPTSSYSANDAAYSVSFGRAVTRFLSLGATGSLISSKIAGISASAYSFDAGALYRPNGKFSFALVGVNFGNELTYLNEGTPLPSGVKLEASYQPRESLAVTAGTTYRMKGPASGRAGIEFLPFRGFALRAGYRTENSNELSGVSGLTAGAGFEIMGQEISYAWIPFGDLGDTHYVSLVFKFGKDRHQPSQTGSSTPL